MTSGDGHRGTDADELSAAVVIATCNRPRQVTALVRSLARQQRPPAQVIVVDDGSDEPVRLTPCLARRSA